MRGSPLTTTILLLLLLLATGAQARIAVDNPAPEQSIAPGMRYLTSEPGVSPQEVLTRFRDGKGIVIRDDYPRLGLINQVAWFFLPLDNRTGQQQWYVEASLPFTDEVRLFVVTPEGEFVSQMRAGDTVPFSEHPVDHPHSVFPVSLPPEEQRTLLFRVSTDNVLDMPVTLFTPEGFQAHDSRRNLSSGFYFGIVAIMCLYNLMIFFSIRDRSYLYYVCYLGFFGLIILGRQGLALQWLWPEQPWWNQLSQPFFTALSLGFAVLFADSFLKLRRDTPRLSRALRILGITLLLIAPLTLLHFRAGLLFTGALLAPWTLGITVLAAVRYFRGFSSAGYFLLAFIPVCITGFLFGLRSFDFPIGHELLEHSLQVSTALEALLLSFALAHRMTALKKENEQIQQRARDELEERVQERTHELNEALNARSQFLATMSHEVRTPLNGILGNVDLVREEGVNGNQARHLRVIEQSGETLLQLINDILDYSKIEAGKMTLERRSFDLPELANETTGLFERQARQNNSRLTVSLNGQLGRFAYGDPLRVRQVLANLVSNAVKFTRDGKIHVSMTRDEANPDYVLFQVDDTGIGIDQEKQAGLFEHFYQLDSSTSRRFGGSGLGLAISRQLVEIMGGEIGVRSKSGEGSRFWFRVPLPPAAPGEAPEPEAHEIIDQSSARLLVVDDNHINLMVAEGLCRKLGHQVITAESGAEALAVLISQPDAFDLVLMDCEMPDMDGFETTRRIQQLQSEGRIGPVPIIALTAHAVPDKIRACREAGMEAHVAKPVNLEKLGRAIRKVLSEPSHGEDGQQKRQAD